MALQIGMLIYPRLTQLDFTGPFEVMHHLPGAQVHVLWKDLQPVEADSGLRFLPSTRLSDCPPLDVLVVPGGVGQMALMSDSAVLDFLAAQGERARYVTAVCTGSLLLGAAGLLRGYDATTHWAYTELLPIFGARHAPGRVVVDRNRFTAGGVTAGIDFGLRIRPAEPRVRPAAAVPQRPPERRGPRARRAHARLAAREARGAAGAGRSLAAGVIRSRARAR